jgi:hypothetical protein
MKEQLSDRDQTGRWRSPACRRSHAGGTDFEAMIGDHINAPRHRATCWPMPA